jgi:hypothetical protein
LNTISEYIQLGLVKNRKKVLPFIQLALNKLNCFSTVFLKEIGFSLYCVGKVGFGSSDGLKFNGWV